MSGVGGFVDQSGVRGSDDVVGADVVGMARQSVRWVRYDDVGGQHSHDPQHLGDQGL